MMETTATLDSAEVVRHELVNAGAGESQAVPAPAIVATTEDIRAGIVLIKSDAPLPNSVQFESKHYGTWKLLTGADGFQVERRLSEAGWHFFLMVPEIRIKALSSNPKRGLRKVLKKLMIAMEAQGLQRRRGGGNQVEALRGVQLRRGRGIRKTGEEQPVSPRSRSLSRVPEYLELQRAPAQTGPDRANPKRNLSTVRAERGLR